MLIAPDETQHPLIDLVSDSSEDEAAAGGPCDVFVEDLVGDALALAHLAVDTSEDDDCEEGPVGAGVWHCMLMYW